MNNNMPNNFNNGMNNGFGPGVTNNNPNNMNQNNATQNNSFVNPVVEKAKEEMMSGQSKVGNGPSIMQGVQGASREPGIMQGVQGASKEPGIMQGTGVVQTQQPQNTNVMPGQHHSGINSYTMQKETVQKPESEVISVPGFDNANQAPSNPQPNIPNFNNAPNQVKGPNVGQPINNEVKIPNMSTQPTQNQNTLNSAFSNLNNIESLVNNTPTQNSGITGNNQNNNLNSGFNNNISNNANNNLTGQNSTIPNTENQNRPLENKILENNLNEPHINNMNQVETPVQANTINNLNKVEPQTTPSIEKQSPILNAQQKQKDIPSNQIINNNQKPTTEIGSTRDLNNAINGIKPTSIGSGMSQVGQTELNSSNQINQAYQEPAKKKFPLSTREMILVGIAIIGIIVVIIMYWPR